MKSEASHENSYDRKIGRAIAIGLWLHLPLMLAVAHLFETSSLEATVYASIIAAGPSLLVYLKARPVLQHISFGIATGCMSGLLIHLGRGMIEMHFYVFVMIGVLILSASLWSVLAHTLTVAVHHVGFFIFLPSSIFNYEATWGIVLAHAGFAIAQTIPCMWIAREFRTNITARSSLRRELKVLIEHSTENMHSVKQMIDQVSKGSQENASAIVESNSILREISARSDANAEAASTTNETSQRVDLSVSAMSQDVHLLNQSMSEIHQASEDVGNIIKSIEEIAFQTNILALNAAVEAARAGEAGAGFSVVADEVRSLAQRSSKSVSETTQLIAQVRNAISESESINMRVKERITELETCSKESRESIGTVAQSCEEQSSAILEIKGAIESIERVSSENANSTDSASQNIADMTERLLKMNQVALSSMRAG